MKKITFIFPNNYDEDLINSIKFNFDIKDKYDIIIGKYNIHDIKTEYFTILDLSNCEYAIYNTTILQDIFNNLIEKKHYLLDFLEENNEYYFDKKEIKIYNTNNFLNNIDSTSYLKIDWFFLLRKFKYKENYEIKLY